MSHYKYFMNLKVWIMKVRQYEIWIADLNPSVGTEPGKIRPVIVIQTDLLNRFHPSSLICPLTTNIQPESDILRVHLWKGSCELKESCDIMVDQTRSIDNKRLVKKIGSAPNEVISKLRDNLKIILDLD
jgi:mRNA interferase MazF